MLKKKKFLLFLSLPLFILAFSLNLPKPQAVLALEGGGIGIRPANPRADEPLSRAWFIYKEAAPQSIIEDEALVTTTSDKTVRVKIEALDAVITQDGGFTLTDDETKNQDIGSWIVLEQKELTVSPNSEKRVKFKLTVPEDAEVGDHAGGLAVSKIEEQPGIIQKVGGGATVGISVRVGVRIYLTVPGDIIRAFKLVRRGYSYPGGQLYLTFVVRNEGNVRNELEADVSVYGVFGRWDHQTIKIGQVLPKKQVIRQIAWPNVNHKKAPFFGPYWALMKISDLHEVENVPAPKAVKIFLLMFFIPWKAVLILVLILFALWLIYQFIVWRRLARLAKAKVVSYKVKRGETLPEIASQYGLGWKFVAALNELKPPYALKEGHQIYLPDARGEKRAGIKLPNYFAQLARPFATFGAWILGSLFRIDKFKRTRGLEKKRREVAKGDLPIARSPVPSRASSYLTAIVEKGDTLASIAKHFQIDKKKIISLNNLKFPFKLTEGQELKIPKPKQRKSQ